MPSTRQRTIAGDRCRDRGSSARTAMAEDDADQAVGRADRQVEVLVDDDEGHADRDDARSARCRAGARGSASPLPKKAGLTSAPPANRAAPSGRAARPPSRRRAGRAGGRVAVRRCRTSSLKRFRAVDKPIARSREGRSPPATWLRRDCERAQFSKRLPTLLDACPWSPAGRACRGWPPRCRGRSADRAA